MSNLDYQQTMKELRRWRQVPEGARVVDLFCERMRRERTLQEIAADIRNHYSDRRAA